MRKQRPILMELQAADAVLRMVNRAGGPRAVRSMLDVEPRARIELGDETVERAIFVMSLAATIPDPRAQRVVLLACETSFGDPVHNRAAIAAMLGVSEKTITRTLNSGLDYIENALAEINEAELPIAA